MTKSRKAERALIATALCAAAGLARAEPVSFADTHTVVLTWRNEGVVHTLAPGDELRPPVIHLAPGWADLGPDDLAGAVDDVARVVSPRPPLVAVRDPGGALLGRWTPRNGFERLDSARTD